MKISDEGIKLIKEFEGTRLEAYVCPAGVLTIGTGHTGPEVHLGLVISEDEATEFLRADLERFERCVESAVGQHVAQCEFDACVSLAFNIGCGAFGKSTLVRKIRSGDYAGAADEFLRWDKAAGKTMKGLTRRRQAERALFLS